MADDLITVRAFLTGDKALLAKLDKLDKKVARKAVTQALRSGGKVVLPAAVDRAPVGVDKPKQAHRAGTLRRALTVRAGKRRKESAAFHVVFRKQDQPKLRTTSKAGIKHFYPGGVEYGTKRHGPQPFMRPAYDASKYRALKTVIDEIHRNVNVAAAGK